VKGRLALALAAPSGTKKFAHVCIENGPARTEDTFANASDTCAAAKRRLPTFAELDAFRQQPGITIGSTSGNRTFPEWTSEFTDLSTSIVLLDNGNTAAANQTTLEPFRCVA
jgi:hypothetical protein